MRRWPHCVATAKELPPETRCPPGTSYVEFPEGAGISAVTFRVQHLDGEGQVDVQVVVVPGRRRR